MRQYDDFENPGRKELAARCVEQAGNYALAWSKRVQRRVHSDDEWLARHLWQYARLAEEESISDPVPRAEGRMSTEDFAVKCIGKSQLVLMLSIPHTMTHVSRLGLPHMLWYN